MEKIQNPISLAQWSYHKALFAGEMDNFSFIKKAAELGFDGVEYVNAFFMDKAQNTAFLDSLKQVAAENNVKSLLIMIDGEGYLGDADILKRDSTVEKHKKWVDAAAYLGCHSIRVNAFGEGSPEEVSAAVVDGLTKLSVYAKTKNINVIVENHGGYSSNGQWLADVMAKVNLDNCGTLPDFGNFCVKREDGAMWGSPCAEEYDRYKGVEEMMPYAKALSAKSHDFDENGEEKHTDYGKMIAIAHAAGYKGYIGVEYEGSEKSEEEGVILTRDLIRAKLK
ncbi:MAG TPA: TIM barrel protein [Saprospiraceae bacterium]|nr:TIM barrel protein [Saprospiraceae bacterium]